MMSIMQQLRASGETMVEDELVRISPLTFSHVIPNGTYFSRRTHSKGSATTTSTNTPLNMEWFLSQKEPRVIIERYRREYNEERPHRSLAYRTAAEANAGLLLPPTARDQEAICDPLQSASLTFSVVQ
jgi:transposase InsO family protein